ncbi:LysR family transcriptional regulator [Peribacillus muralis]|uniref:LysR family transcriptional regulator n=1 Tax=Peribacillus muralis TaxID=264697 RepID=UPI001F4DCB78|nr:LysR family transcriptional regulator [Peribacillus muralis]MCK1993988.1 LysR family transcriptional regulator [Peribacillus muralis]MCK2014543.1 LysR family transcriptional regulator [Peribacillus muralis]
MNIDHIEAFMYVVHLNSFHKAAEAMFLTQPTISARIRTLESELDSELFERQGRGIILTEKGKAFIPFAEQIIRTFQQGKKQLKAGSDLEEITIGANIITSQYFIPFAIPYWNRENPNLRFKFISATNDVLKEKLLQKQVDIAFMKDVTHSGLQNHKILDNSIRLVVYPGHPFQIQTELTVQVLAKEPLVFFECGAFDWNHVHKIFEVSNVEPRIEFQVDHLEVAKSLILSKSCIGFLPYLCIKNELEQGTLVEVDVSHLIKIKQHIYLTHLNQGVEAPLLWNDILFSIRKYEENHHQLQKQSN